MRRVQCRTAFRLSAAAVEALLSEKDDSVAYSDSSEDYFRVTSRSQRRRGTCRFRMRGKSYIQNLRVVILKT